MKKPLISVIIPVKEINDYLRKETIPLLLKQSYPFLEIIILPDYASTEKFPKTKIISTFPNCGPADKRDLGAKLAKGKILGFLDDDSYPDKRWAESAICCFENINDVVAVCGPTLTPPKDGVLSKVVGHVLSSWLGSAGAGSYRNRIGKEREVDDYPSVNLLVRKSAFVEIGGFDVHCWPGEDTKLCHELVYKLGRKIIYNPKVLVYHHRRIIFKPYLKQISGYAIHRGYFAKILPKTSRRIGYFIPSLFVLGLIGFPLFVFLLDKIGFVFVSALLLKIYKLTILTYLIALLCSSAIIAVESKDIILSLLSIPVIFMTHITYGIFFIRGIFTKNLPYEKEKPSTGF